MKRIVGGIEGDVEAVDGSGEHTAPEGVVG